MKQKSEDLSPGVAVGFCEALGGALLCIVPIPGARAAGVIMITDGVRRMIDDATESEDTENKMLDP